MTGAVVKHDVIMLMFVPQWGGGGDNRRCSFRMETWLCVRVTVKNARFFFFTLEENLKVRKAW